MPRSGTADAADPPAKRVVQSVSRAANLMKAMANKGRPMGLSDLAAAIGISKPATYHLLRTLEMEGFVAKGPDALYQLDWGLYELGSAVIRSVSLTQIARGHLDRLADETGEAVLLSILDDRSVLYLDRGQSAESFVMVANVGRRSPLHTNASGKVLLAFQPPDVVAAVLSRPLEAKTPSTVCNPQVLAEQLARAQADGYATCWQEQEIGLCSVACPIFDYTGGICAGIAIAGPAERIDEAAVPALAAAARREALAISQKLGWADTH